MAASNPHNNFRQKLLSGDCLIGTFVKTPSMMVAEVLASTDLDVACFDAEHSPFDRRDIDSCLLAFRAEQKPALVRVASSSADQILNALDCGATGVVIPHVDSPEKALACVNAARYGRIGRGYAGSTRSAGYGKASVADNISLNQSETTVIAQIEDIAAVDNIDAMILELCIHTFPKTGGRRRGDGNTTLLLLFHPIHGCRAVVNLTDFVRKAGIEKHSLGGGGFAGIYVSADSDVAIATDGGCARHNIIL